MREKAAAKKNTAARVSRRVPWTVVEVEPLPDYRLNVRFADGTEGVVDASRMIFGRNPGVFAVLRDPIEFAKARVNEGAVTWPGELDLAPDSMYDRIKADGHYVLSE